MNGEQKRKFNGKKGKSWNNMKINDIKNPAMIVKTGQGNEMGFYKAHD